MPEKKTPTVEVKFKWTHVSPDPQDVVMRNNLEPVELFVQIEVPLKHEYLANADEALEAREMTIKASLSPDIESAGKEPEPILTIEGMKYVVQALSLRQAEQPIEEDFEDEDWNEEENSEDDWSEDENLDDEEW